ncbi:hypothetical protein [Arsenicibacter rosenii]|uniref:Uncharacterized protein n=1 Tax=Arsenicibacter rosenii TaxID=1750698 RepID=A0A1S2VNK9_9BACT|nr:hypothetical protein [Arsenicibacter rosenii]OIN59795.1 hypothetical protein BLX24_08025 [Arsenicibacter rosenii]
MFKPGTVVKSRLRTEKHPLFLIVVDEYREDESDLLSFKAVVLTDKGNGDEYYPGELSNAWNTPNFIVSSWAEVKEYLHD